MKTRSVLAMLAAVGVTAFLAGTVFSEEGEGKPKVGAPEPPPPPPQLKALDTFAGTWRGTYEFLPAMFGEPGKGTALATNEWVLNSRFLMLKGKGTGSFGDYEWIEMMTYDPMLQSYRSFGFDSHGSSFVATLNYAADTRTWTMVYDGYDMSGKPAENKTVMRFVGDDKLEWELSVKSQGETEFVQWMKGTDLRAR